MKRLEQVCDWSNAAMKERAKRGRDAILSRGVWTSQERISLERAFASWTKHEEDDPAYDG